MKNTEMKVVKFNNEDIIATSGYMFANLGDANATNNTFAGISYTNDTQFYGAINAMVAKDYKIENPGITKTTTVQSVGGVGTISLASLFGSGSNATKSKYSELNGKAYEWNTTLNRFTRI